MDGNIIGVSMLASSDSSAKEADGFTLSSRETRIEVASKDVLVEDVIVLSLVGEMSRIDGVGVQVLNVLVSDTGITTESGKIKEQDGE